MGLISETINEAEAKRLEEVLLKGIETKNLEVTTFLKENLYEHYLSCVAETFGSYKGSQEVQKYYGGKLN